MSTSSNQRGVVFVDDDTAFLEALELHMEQLSRGQWRVFGASSPSDALKILDSQPVHLAVLDLHMPVVDGGQLLQLIHRKYPQVKKAVLSGHVDDACRTSALNSGAELVLEKPRSVEGFESVFAALNELLRWNPEKGFSGVLRRVGLEDVLQMECLSRHSLILEIVGQDASGRIYIKEGSLIHAEFRDLIGEPAFQDLLTLTGGEFQYHPFSDPPRRSLEGSWEFLLMEAMRKRDEAMHGVSPTEEEEVSAAPVTPIAQAVAQPPTIYEMVVSSRDGEALYNWQSPDPGGRCELIRTLHEVSRRMEALMAIGALERVEFQQEENSRMLVRLQDVHGIFVHAQCAIDEHGT